MHGPESWAEAKIQGPGVAHCLHDLCERAWARSRAGGPDSSLEQAAAITVRKSSELGPEAEKRVTKGASRGREKMERSDTTETLSGGLRGSMTSAI